MTGLACRKCGSRNTRLVKADGAPDPLAPVLRTLENLPGVLGRALARPLQAREQRTGTVLVCGDCGHWGRP